jgi:exopolysaccharide biosynthesis polyprenyl glycosylphosphotransferase
MYHFPSTPAAHRLAIPEHIGVAILYAVLIILFGHTQRLYSTYQPPTFAAEFTAILKSVFLATLLLGGCLFLTGVKSTSRFIIGCTAVSAILTMTAWRQYRRHTLKRAVADGLTCHNVLIVGTDPLAQTVAEHLAHQRQLGFLVVGHLATPDQAHPHPNQTALSPVPPAPKILGTTTQLQTLCRTHFIDEVIVCTHHRPTVLEVISDAREAGVGVHVIPDLYDGLAWGARLDYLGDFPTLTVVHRTIPALSLAVKRAIDIVGAAFALTILSPLLLLIALIVKLDSRGPILYSSKRLGRKGRPFPCYKFRTMVADADIQKAKLQHLNERDGILFKITNDPRITRAGRFLRKHSLDELPQFWNVLRGDMSLVGPRPPLANEVSKYETGYFRRLNVAPGITGLWQVEARNNPSFDKYISLDLHYIENWSLSLDIQILFRTVSVVLAGTGS